MKKVFMGAGALALAIGAVAFTNAPKKASLVSGSYYFAVTAASGLQPIAGPLATSPLSGCVGALHFCAAEFTGNFTKTSAGINWIPTANTIKPANESNFQHKN